MRVAIEALGIHYFGGGRTATLHLLEALLAQDADTQYLFVLTQPEPSLVAPNARQWIAPVKNRFALRLWAQAALPLGLRGYDLVHFAKNLGVFGMPIRSVVTVYDLTPLVHPELFPRSDLWYWRYVEGRTLATARRVIAISHNTAQDLQRFYHLPAERLRVIYPACAPHFGPATTAQVAAARQRYGLADDYVIHVGHIDRKKNLPDLIRAFAELRRAGFGGQLVLVGEVYQKSQDRSVLPLIEALDLGAQVRLTGGVPDADLPALYTGAQVAVFPSQHEGFGLAALEALACGTPLVTTRAGAVAEVVGEAAVVLEQSDVAGLTSALQTVLDRPELRQSLRARGLARAKDFRWDEAARRTRQVYTEVAG